MNAKEEALGADRLKELLSYNPDTGEFLWLVSGGGVAAGRVAGRRHGKGYRAVTVTGRLYLAHRLAWLYVHGEWPEDEIDHKNGVRDDNRIANLREANKSQNQGNQRKARTDSYTGLLGASWERGGNKFRAQIRLNGKKKHLGLFNTAEEAHAAYIKAKRELHPFCTI